MAQVSIDVNGRSYTIACDDGEEVRISELGRELGARVEALTNVVGQVGDARLLVMAGLLLVDELQVARAEGGGTDGGGVSEETIVALAEYLNSLAEQAERVAAKLEHT